ncbi:MAG: winged helix-turn-helix domain-containing protein [Prevotellaceae bacterium]|nr:winged helix-turn-helix domain-containing protein [Prevotellaceae bacterium]
MRQLLTKPYLSNEQLKSKLQEQTDLNSYINWQIIYSIQTNLGAKAELISSILGISIYKIYRVIQAYNKRGADWDKGPKRGGRREERCLMSLEEEHDFLKSIEHEAINGQIITYKQVQLKLEKQLGRKVSDDYVWDLFKRRGWSKKVPRKSHPKANKAAQSEYKKNSLNYWNPSN